MYATFISAPKKNVAAGKGVVKIHTATQYSSGVLTTFGTWQCLYIHDGAFVFRYHRNTASGLKLIHKTVARFRLEMNVGRGDTQLKIECVFFPPPLFFKDDNFIEGSLGSCENQDE